VDRPNVDRRTSVTPRHQKNQTFDAPIGVGTPRRNTLYPVRLDARLARDLVQTRGALFESLDRSLGLSMVTRAGGELAMGNEPPAHEAVDRRGRPALDHRERHLVRVGELRGLAGRLAIRQPVRPMSVERHFQFRTIYSVTPPILAACVREAPS